VVDLILGTVPLPARGPEIQRLNTKYAPALAKLVFHVGKSVPIWDDESRSVNATGTGRSHRSSEKRPLWARMGPCFSLVVGARNKWRR